MALTHQDTAVNQLIINRLTKQEFDNLPSYSNTELYIVPEQLDSVVTQNSTNPVQSGAVYNAIQDNHEIIFCHMLDGEIFNETVIECTEVNGEIFDPQELIDRPDDPRPLFPDGNYYYATNTNKVYGGEVGDNEFIDVTVSVMIEGDETKLYCDVDSDKLYRYDGTNYVALAPSLANVAFSGSYNDLSDKPLSVESSKVKYTLSDGTTKLTLAQEGDLKEVAFSGSYTDLTNRPFKDFTLTTPDTAVTAGTWMGLIKWSRTDINERVEIFGGWTTGTLGMITIEVKGRPVASMGYSISYSTPAMDKSYTLAVGVKDEEVYLLFKYNQSNYKSGASIRLTGFRNNYAENLNFAIFTEYSSLTFVKTIEVSKS